MVSARSKSKGEKPMFRIFSTMILAGLATIPAAYAQSGQPIEARIPFAFLVNDATLAAGKYQLMYNHSAHSLLIRGLDGNPGGAFVTAIPTSAPESSASPSLVFECYGKSCYLARVSQGSIGSGRGLEVSEPQHGRKLTFETRVVYITIPAK
jgi:hypothetical protein